MRHIRCCVEQSMDAVAAVALHNAVAMCLNMLLNDVADFAVPFARLHDGNGLLQSLVRHFNQVLVFLGHIPNEKCLIQIAMEAAMINGHIHVAQISILCERQSRKWFSQ